MKLTWTILFALLPLFLIAQQGGQTQNEAMIEISPDEPFQNVLQRIDDRYSSNESRQGRDYKFYRRWRSEIDYKLTPNESVKNYSRLNVKAYQNEKKKAGPLASNARNPYGEWTNVGPFDYNASDAYSGGGVGRVNCTAFHPTNSNIMWVGSGGGGMWKTTNGGDTWSPMTDHFGSLSISDIAVHPTDPDIIYVLTGDGDAYGLGLPPFVNGTSAWPGSSSIGVMKTTDGGDTWSETGLTFSDTSLVNGYRLLINPDNPDILIAGMNGQGTFRTTDGGDVWIQQDPSITVWDMEFKPDDAQTIYAATSLGFRVSLDAGATWATENDPTFPPIDGSRIAVAISPSAPENVYLLFSNNTGAGSFGGLYKSMTGGVTFFPRSFTPCILAGDTGGSGTPSQPQYDHCLVVDPTDDSRVFVGSVNIWKSDDSGTTWSRETWWTRSFHPIDPYVHADIHNLYFLGNTLIANNDGGIYKSNDYGNSWTEISSGLSLMMFYEIDIQGGEYMGGTQDNGTNATNISNTQIHQLWGGDGFGCTWHTQNTDIQYLSTQNAIYRRQFGVSVPISPIETGDNDHWNCEINMHTTDADYVFAATFNEMYRGNGSQFDFNWDVLGTAPFFTGPFNRVFDWAQGTSDPETMYVVNQNTIIRTDNLSEESPDWTPLPNPTSGNAFISYVEVDPENTTKIWIVCSGYSEGNKVFYSNTSGTTWTNISDNLPNVPIRCITYHPGTNDGLYIGTDIGIYYRNNGIGEWIYFSNQLPNVVVRDIEVNDTHVYAGTYGRGMWESEHFSSCPINLVLTPANDPSNPLSLGEQHYSASNSIISTRKVTGGMAEIYYSADNFVDLKPGFEAEKSNFFVAKPDGCPE